MSQIWAMCYLHAANTVFTPETIIEKYRLPRICTSHYRGGRKPDRKPYQPNGFRNPQSTNEGNSSLFMNSIF